MPELSAEVDAIARKSHSTALRRIAQRGQNHVAAALSISPTTVSRHLSDEDAFARSLRILAAAGLKVVPADWQCFAPRKVEILLELARDHLAQMQRVDQLEMIDDDD